MLPGQIPPLSGSLNGSLNSSQAFPEAGPKTPRSASPEGLPRLSEQGVYLITTFWAWWPGVTGEVPLRALNT